MPQTNVMTVKMMFRVAVDPTDADSVGAAALFAKQVLALAASGSIDAKITHNRFQTIRGRAPAPEPDAGNDGGPEPADPAADAARQGEEAPPFAGPHQNGEPT